MNCPWCGQKAQSRDDEGWSCDDCNFSFSTYYVYLWRKYRPLRRKIRESKEKGEFVSTDALVRIQEKLDLQYPDLPCLRVSKTAWTSLVSSIG